MYCVVKASLVWNIPCSFPYPQMLICIPHLFPLPKSMGARKYVIEIVWVSEGFLFQYIYLIQLKLPWTWYIMFCLLYNMLKDLEVVILYTLYLGHCLVSCILIPYLSCHKCQRRLMKWGSAWLGKVWTNYYSFPT